MRRSRRRCSRGKLARVGGQEPVLTATVFVGGMLGAWARYRFSGWVFMRTGAAFPWGTLAVNVVGSLLLGIGLVVLAQSAGEPWAPVATAFLTVGVLGAFTTFSTFAYDAVMLLQAGERGRAALYAAVSVALGVASVAAGMFVASHIP